MLYIAGRDAYVHARDACGTSRTHTLVPVEFRTTLLCLEGTYLGAQENLGRIPIGERLMKGVFAFLDRVVPVCIIHSSLCAGLKGLSSIARQQPKEKTKKTK